MSGCSVPEKQEYELYSREIPGDRTLSVEYPAGWKSGSHWGDRGAFYQVLFFPEQGTLPKPLISVAVYFSGPTALSGAREFLDDTIRKRLLFNQSSVLGQSSLQTSGESALQVLMRYRRPRDIHKLGNDMVFVKERIVILRKGESLMMLRFEHDENNFDATSPLFDHFLQTLSVS